MSLVAWMTWPGQYGPISTASNFRSGDPDLDPWVTQLLAGGTTLYDPTVACDRATRAFYFGWEEQQMKIWSKLSADGRNLTNPNETVVESVFQIFDRPWFAAGANRVYASYANGTGASHHAKRGTVWFNPSIVNWDVYGEGADYAPFVNGYEYTPHGAIAAGPGDYVYASSLKYKLNTPNDPGIEYLVYRSDNAGTTWSSGTQLSTLRDGSSTWDPQREARMANDQIAADSTGPWVYAFYVRVELVNGRTTHSLYSRSSPDNGQTWNAL